MNFIVKAIQGFLIGVGAIAPGVSGGTIAIIFGLYDKITDAIAHFYRDTIGKIKFFLPVGIGGVLGVLLFSRIMDFLFTSYEFQTKYFFIGLLLGSLPSVFKEATSKGFKRSYLIPFALAVGVTVAFELLDRSASGALLAPSESFPMMMLYGAIIGFGLIVPGISASFILMYLGSYDTLMGGIGRLDFSILIPAGIGGLLAILLFAKLVSWLFNKAYGMTFFGGLGFVIGSMLMVFPGVDASAPTLLLSIALFLLGAAGTYAFGKLSAQNT